MPRIDKNIYTRENAWAIRGLLALYNITNDQQVLERALKAARWIVKHHRLEEGGFMHGKNDRGGPFLGDNLAMGASGSGSLCGHRRASLAQDSARSRFLYRQTFKT